MKREIRGALTGLALVVTALLAVVAVQPGLPLEQLFDSLRFHVAAALLVLVIALSLSGAHLRAGIFGLIFAAAIGQGALIILDQQQARDFAKAGTTPLLKLVSFNTLQDNRPNGKRIADWLIASGADVIYLMEGGPVTDEMPRLRQTYPYTVGCDGGRECSTIMLSKTPLTDVGIHSLSSVWSNRLIVAKTIIKGVSINLVQAHMVKPYFDDFAEGEAYVLASGINKLEGPVLLAGDFNAAAWSANIDNLRKAAKLAPPPNYPATWPIRLGPAGVPIDNVWTRAPLVITHIEAMDDAMGSNHRGLVAEIGLAVPASAASTSVPSVGSAAP
jgi:endonuclease/exonuclease/phosphatase (EEP) superfamily protein YafD